MVRQKGLEPPTYCLEGSCSIRMSYWRVWLEQVTRIELASPAWKAGALTIVLHLRAVIEIAVAVAVTRRVEIAATVILDLFLWILPAAVTVLV